MVDADILEEIDQILKGKNIIMLGDSLMRGMYKDLACILTGQKRLLYVNELKFNRHRIYNQQLFGENIEELRVDGANSVNNVEKRVLKLKESNISLCYIFCSRIWNKRMQKLLTSLKNYDIVLLQSGIWDLTRYGDVTGEIYLTNMGICFSQLQKIKTGLIWISNPPIGRDKYHHLNVLLTSLKSSILEKAKKYNFETLDLSEILEAQLDLLYDDKIHWSPSGHRLMSYHLIKCIKKLSNETWAYSNDENSFSNSSITQHQSIVSILFNNVFFVEGFG